MDGLEGVTRVGKGVLEGVGWWNVLKTGDFRGG